MLTFVLQQRQQLAYTRRHATIVIQALLALPMLMWLMACANLEWPAAENRQKHRASASSPTIIAASFDKSGITLEFDQAMVTDITLQATALYRLNNHVGLDNIANFSERVETTADWRDSRHLHLSWNLSAGSYVLQVTSGAMSVSGRALDGLAGRGQVLGIHRPDDDFMDGPANYQSQVFYIGHLSPRFAAPPPYAYLSISEVTALQKSAPDGELDQVAFTFWRWGESRIGRFPLLNNTNNGWRLNFYSPAGGRYAMPSPTDLGRYLKIVNESRASLPGLITSLSNRSSAANQLKNNYEVVAAFGLRVTVTTGPELELADLRADSDFLWLLLGKDASPRSVTALVADWDPLSKTFELASTPLPISGYVHGTTVSSNRSWLAGELAGGYALRLSNGMELAIADATAYTIYLQTATAPTDCSGCSVVFVDAAARIAPGDQVLLTSNTWYVHFSFEPPAQERQFFSLNAADLLRSLAGTAFRDRERDGRENISVPKPQDEFVLQIAFRDPTQPYPPYSRLNDGMLYSTAFAAAGLDCLGSTPPICVTAIDDVNCGTKVPAIAHFSFYTADGQAGQFGPSDLVDLRELRSEYVQVYANDGRTPLDTALRTKVVINSAGSASIATTVLSVELAARDNNKTCANGKLAQRGFREGDILRISHLLRTQAVVEPRTLDGDGDGVARASSEDDWLGVWRDAAQTFVTLERFPQSP